MGSLLFKPFKDKSARSGWQASNSLVTDGVSLCITYEKQVRKPVFSKEVAEKRRKTSAQKAKQKEQARL